MGIEQRAFSLRNLKKFCSGHGLWLPAPDGEQSFLRRYIYGLALLIAGVLLLLLIGGLLSAPAVAQQTPAQDGRAVNQPAIAVIQTVGTAVGICPPNAAIAVSANTTVHYCVTLRNSGDVALSRHTLFSSLLNQSVTFTQTLNPGQEIALTTNVLNSLGQSFTLATSNVTTNLTHTVTITSTNGQGTVATGQAVARVVIGTVGVKIVKTVGLTSGTTGCTTATKGIAVNANTTVFFCITIQNTGSLPLVKHYVRDPLLNIDRELTTAPIVFGTPVAITNWPELEYFVTQSVTNTVFFTSTTAEGISVSAQDQASVLVGQPGIDLTYTIGSDSDPCGTATSLTIASGRPVQHCLRIQNNGAVPFTNHTLQWSQNNVQLLNTTITQTLQPGQSIVISSTTVPQLTQANVTASANHLFTVTSRNRQGVSATATKSAQVIIGTQTLSVQKYVSIDRNVCVTRPLPAPPLNIAANQPFYYCLVVTNSGTIPFVRHTFNEGAPLNISAEFTYPLAPGARITLTNNFLTGTLGLPALFGPLTASVNVPGSMAFTAFSAGNVQSAQTVAFQINVAAPTLTPTTPPPPFPTFTPTISPTPSPSLTSPPTPTPTPVVVSFQPTPTPAFGIGSVTTPTPGVFPGAAPPGTDAFAQPTSPLDPLVPTVDFTSTAIAVTMEAAATQTALAFIPPPVTDTPSPLPTVTPLLETPTETPLLTTTDVVTPTLTPVVLALAPLPTPAPSSDYLDLTAQVFQVSTATLGWLWFLGGSIIFFATAGMFAGLSLQQRRRQQTDDFIMTEDGSLDEYTFDPIAVDPITAPDTSIDQPADDDDNYWPASLR